MKLPFDSNGQGEKGGWVGRGKKKVSERGGEARNNFQPTLHSLPLPFGESARFSAFSEWVAGGVGEKKRRGSKGEPINSGV